MEKQTAEYWIKHLNLVEHPGEEKPAFFSVPFEDTFKVTSVTQVNIWIAWLVFISNSYVEMKIVMT